jgi:uncharacterized SAM-binding protein YcdF (DUF218 family)
MERLTGFFVGLSAGLLVKELGLRYVVSYWGPMTLPVIVLSLVCALAWPRAKKIVVGVALSLAALCLVVAYTPLTRALVPGLVRHDPERAADAIFVLSSHVQPDDDPSAEALSRATRGLELLGRGLAPRLYLSELRKPAGSYVRYLTASAERMGLPGAHAIESVGVVGNTHDEALRTAEIFRAHGWKRLLLVTSPTHTRRAAATFERAGIPEVIAVPSVETVFDVEALRMSDDRLMAFGPILHEWVGLMIYRWRGWI